MVRSVRFELTAYPLGGDCSIQLSYERLSFRAIELSREARILTIKRIAVSYYWSLFW